MDLLDKRNRYWETYGDCACLDVGPCEEGESDNKVAAGDMKLVMRVLLVVGGADTGDAERVGSVRMIKEGLREM
jgi:hypothetical protein